MLARLLPRFSPFDKLDWPTLLSLSRHCRVLTMPSGRRLASKGKGRYYLLRGSVSLAGSRKITPVSQARRRQDHIPGVISHGTDQARYPLDTSACSRLETRRVCQLLWIDTEPVAFLLDCAEQRSESKHHRGGNECGWMHRFLGGHLFHSVSALGLQNLVRAMSIRKVKQDEQIIRKGDTGNTFYVLSEGHAEIVQDEPLASLGPGDFFGEDALISGMRRNVDVTMTADGELRCMSAEAFHALLTNKIIRNASLSSGAFRLDVSLAGFCKENGAPNVIHIPVCLLRDSLNQLNFESSYVVTGDTMPECRLATFILLHHGFKASCCLPLERHQAGTVRPLAQVLNA